jgi:hypothetical protein
LGAVDRGRRLAHDRGQKVDFLYRPIESVETVIRDCWEGRVSLDYQPGHPHSFCSAIWMGEVALAGRSATLKAQSLD